ncbi:hypothetical protein CDL12_02628 [Handroanthus impetiginosus]|uniref:Uncharacterized protein n=1 Tax=Handroanthus impetiginosus TaxID=429701 RepID=A0A2G9I4G3_9LAMI|nr:hypothetical protein CDL12_02628 [Handroanthus impetiginosus]
MVIEMLKQIMDSIFSKETIRNEKISGKKKRKREVEEWLKNVKMIENELRTLEIEVQTQGFLRMFLSGDQVTQLNRKIHELIEQSRHFGELLVDANETRGEALLTINLFGEGFKENLERMEKFLESDKLSIGIYSMGGVGKTNSAKHVNNLILEKNQEKRVCWIAASQAISIKRLPDQRAHFIDDVWEYICLKKLGDLLLLEGCKLILTTRSFQVSCRMVEVKKLHTEEAWNLFKQILEQDIALAPQIEESAKNMAKVCDGLPLAIIVLAGNMSGETSIHVWRDELEKLRDLDTMQDDMEDKVFNVLKYSFDRLDSSHQLCFLHSSFFPEDFQINIDDLVKRFISEELVNIRKSRQSQFDQGLSILNKLVKVCLLERDGEYYVKMHDLVRAMALKIAKRKYGNI